MAIASIWSSMANWSTPAVLFCVLNLMIATIFIASNFKPSNNNHHHYHLNDNNPTQLTRYEVNHETTASHSASQLSRPLSLLQRVKSIDFKSFPSFHNSFTTESDNSTSELTRAPSFLDRFKSFKLTSRNFTSDDHHSGDTLPNADEHSGMGPDHDLVEEHNNNVTEQSFETSGVTPAKRSPSNLLKSRSEKRVVALDSDKEDVHQRRPATMKAAVGVRDECVDTKAEDFIKRFKQQLKLQRLDSLQKLKEMLNRGTSSA